jgi:hypothetical protein
MSHLQSKTKPILVPLLDGKRFLLTNKQQLQLATWATMFVMVAELSLRKKELAAVTQGERSEFKRTRKPLKNWKFWIAAIDHPDWIGRYVHTSMRVASKRQASKTTEGVIPVPNTQTTTFVVNKLYIHTISSTARGLDLGKQEIRRGMAQRIWPRSPPIIQWPPRDFLSSSDAEWLSRAFFDGAISRTR